MIDKLDAIAIRIYNWFVLKFVAVIFIVILVFLSVIFGAKIEDTKEIIKDGSKFIENLAYGSNEDDKK